MCVSKITHNNYILLFLGPAVHSQISYLVKKVLFCLLYCKKKCIHCQQLKQHSVTHACVTDGHKTLKCLCVCVFIACALC